MRKISSPQAQSAPSPAVQWRRAGSSCPSALKALLLPSAACGVLALSALLPAQTQSAQQQPPPAQTSNPPIHHRKRPAATHPAVAPAPAGPTPAAVTPPVPEQPKWPVFDPAGQASVVWDSQGLRIEATNSSLQQILNEVALETGVKVDGLTADQRIFGAYGPGQARDVLSQLLQGSGYNVIMIGDQGHGTPRELLLSARQAATGQPAVRNNPAPSTDEDVVEPEDPPAQPENQPVRPPFPPGVPPRSPQQFEMQQRQQQMQMQQQQQQQANPPN
jgi:hypothetical protein